MDFTPVLEDLKKDKLAARRFEKEGHRKFRDCVIVGRNGRLLFQRFCWGEAASLMFSMKGSADAGGNISWGKSQSEYDPVDEAPQRLTGYADGALVFDEGKLKWPPAAELKRWPEGGLGFFGRLFS